MKPFSLRCFQERATFLVWQSFFFCLTQYCLFAKMPLSKFQATTLLGVAVFLVGVACFVAAALHRVFPARAEQNLKAINCTITSGDMEMKVKCSHNKHGDTSYPCLRVYVLCGNETKRSGFFEDERPRLLRRDFYSIHEKVT